MRAILLLTILSASLALPPLSAQVPSASVPPVAPLPSAGSVVVTELTSECLRANHVGVDPRRSVLVYLPPGYADSGRRYPVIYYFHGFFWSPQQMFADGGVIRLFDRAIARDVIGEFILVAADFSTPGRPGSFHENSSTSGRWLDFTTQELVPFIDAHFRTLPEAASRGLAGEMIGGYGALKLALLHPELFSTAYALHPVGTGTGLVPMASRPDWPRTHAATRYEDLAGDGFSSVFLAMAQAYLPNPDRPPFYCDFLVEPEGREFKFHPGQAQTLRQRFLLGHLLESHADNLRRLRGFAFDWGRYDPNQDHVFANQAFTRQLEELGVPHLAKEYRGGAWDQNWLDDGRVYARLLPFFARHLTFDPNADQPAPSGHE